jgi:hypothetical protein
MLIEIYLLDIVVNFFMSKIWRKNSKKGCFNISLDSYPMGLWAQSVGGKAEVARN